MLSNDELTRGVPFILQLREAAGGRPTWMEMLRGEIARRWYEIYRRSDWATLRQEATGVFHHRVAAAEAERVRQAGRCVVIRTDFVDASELQPAGVN
jgi:hypothetical protein